MKIHLFSILFFIAIIIAGGCLNKRSSGKKEVGMNSDTIGTPDSVVKYFSNQLLLKEVAFKNGVRNGLTKTYYPGGQLYQTFWYVNDLKEDSATWYYTEGQVFRTTPYKRDTVDGTQRQYYRTGEIRAKIGYSKGLRTTLFQEFNKNGKLVKEYPQIIFETVDEYKNSDRYKINLSLSDSSKRVKFYKGEFTDNRFDTAKCQVIRTLNGKASLILKKAGVPAKNYVGIIGEITTLMGNRYLTYKKIDLPYNDLK